MLRRKPAVIRVGAATAEYSHADKIVGMRLHWGETTVSRRNFSRGDSAHSGASSREETSDRHSVDHRKADIFVGVPLWNSTSEYIRKDYIYHLSQPAGYAT